jgi:hypothetical protein
MQMLFLAYVENPHIERTYVTPNIITGFPFTFSTATASNLKNPNQRTGRPRTPYHPAAQYQNRFCALKPPASGTSSTTSTCSVPVIGPWCPPSLARRRSSHDTMCVGCTRDTGHLGDKRQVVLFLFAAALTIVCERLPDATAGIQTLNLQPFLSNMNHQVTPTSNTRSSPTPSSAR